MVRRTVKKTVLIYGEGLHEYVFLVRLRQLYNKRFSSVGVTLVKGRGGSPASIVRAAIRHSGDYQRRVAIVDNDKSPQEIEEAQKHANENGVVLIINTPCVDNLLLSILDEKENYATLSPAEAKALFEKKYVPHSKRRDVRVYEPILTKTKLEQARKRIPELDRLINIIKSGQDT